MKGLSLSDPLVRKPPLAMDAISSSWHKLILAVAADAQVLADQSPAKRDKIRGDLWQFISRPCPKSSSELKARFATAVALRREWLRLSQPALARA